MSQTLKSIPVEKRGIVTVLTNDEEISHEVALYGCQSNNQGEIPNACESNLREALWAQCQGIEGDQVVTILTTGYPNRTWEDITLVWNYWKLQKGIKSLLCRNECSSHPWNCIANVDMYDKAEQLIQVLTGNPHTLTDKDEYPSVWEVSRFVIMFKMAELQCLNPNMYNSETRFYMLDKKQLKNRIT